MRLLSAAEMRELDRRAIEELGLPGLVLMESAGRGAVGAIEEHYADAERVRVLAGRGNNGGDGFVVARYLLTRDLDVAVLLLGEAASLRGDARTQYEMYERLGGETFEILSEEDLDAQLGELAVADLLVDALLGTGLERPVEGLFAYAIETMNILDAPILAIDVPSGLSSETGHPMGVAVEADATVTFGFPKIGLFSHPGPRYAGRVEIVDIGIPEAFAEDLGVPGRVADEAEVGALLAPRDPGAHKGDAGRVLVLAGSALMPGAAKMTARAALRAGAGLVTLGLPSSVQPAVAASVLEIMTAPVHGPDGGFHADGVEAALALAEGMDAVALGPGIGQNAQTKAFVQRFVGAWAGRLVLDADGLNVLAGNLAKLRDAPGEIVLTPHPGEAARLLGATVEEVQADRVGAALRLARESGCVAVLKGAGTVTASPDGRFFVNPTGNPGMATGGMGDALTGAIAALLAGGLPALEAAVLGVHVHGLAGDLVAGDLGGLGMVAGDVIEALPRALRRLLEGEPHESGH